MARKKTLVQEIRTAVANYMKSEGCSCCRDYKGHKEHEAKLAKLLRVPAYEDGSGYDFGKFEESPNANS